MKFIGNMLRSDRPESPTDVAFVIGFFCLLALQCYVTITTEKGIPDIATWLTLLTALKSVKVGKDFVTNKWGGHRELGSIQAAKSNLGG